MLTPERPGNCPTLLKRAPVGVDSLRRLTCPDALAFTTGHSSAAATSRWARASAMRSMASLASRFAAAARPTREVSSGSLKFVHHAAASAGPAVTWLGWPALACALAPQAGDRSGVGGLKFGPTVQPDKAPSA